MIAFLAAVLRPLALACVATDLNPHAAQATARTAARNGATVDVLLTSLTDGLCAGRRAFDVILFNPPYVPSERLCPPAERPSAENVLAAPPDGLLEAAWAGGQDGRHWIDLVLPRINSLLSPRGVLYMVVLEANRPAELVAWARREWRLEARVVAGRRAGHESLAVLKFWRSPAH